jgi:hypothetical protein
MTKKMTNMKHSRLIAIGALLLLGVGGAAAQSLGDYAKAARKNKAEPSSTTRHFDNDNLPTDDSVSVVGPPPAADAKAAETAQAANVSAADTNADRQKTADEWAKKLDQQKAKIDTLNHELDLDQREYRLRAAEIYGDAGNRLRNQAEWDKEDKQYRSDMETKQKAVADAQQKLDEMQEQERKAGVVDNDKDSRKGSDTIKQDSSKDNN